MGQGRDLVDQVWQALDNHDFEAFRRLAVPGGTVVMPGGLTVGMPDDLISMLQAYVAAFPDMRHEVLDSVESGDTIAVELRVTATHTGPFRTPEGEIPATGKKVAWDSVDFIKIREGRVLSWHTYFDQLTFLQQLGLAPQPETAGV
jgi:predicted ester cyclase